MPDVHVGARLRPRPPPLWVAIVRSGSAELIQDMYRVGLQPQHTSSAQRSMLSSRGVQSTDAAHRARRRPPGIWRQISLSVISAIIQACSRGSHVSWAARKGHPRVKQPRL